MSKTYYQKVFLDECKYAVKEIKTKNVIDDESNLDSSDNESDKTDETDKTDKTNKSDEFDETDESNEFDEETV